jgi:L-asparaginase
MGLATKSLIRIAMDAVKLAGDSDPRDVVTSALCGMEDDPLFNAGMGSALQQDGVPRLTAALMDGEAQSFSGVISLCQVRHPSLMARELQSHSSRVLTAPGHEWLARKMNLPTESLVTKDRLDRWYQRTVNHLADGSGDTVGCVFLGRDGKLAAGTSTGGRGFEVPGRVSDSATVAGNYASRFAAVSATGVGEQIVDDALAAKIEIRCRDGLTLKQSCEKALEEAKSRGRAYGWIAVTQTEWAACFTTDGMSFVAMDLAGKILASS